MEALADPPASAAATGLTYAAVTLSAAAVAWAAAAAVWGECGRFAAALADALADALAPFAGTSQKLPSEFQAGERGTLTIL